MPRKTGKHATLTIGSYAGADLFDCEVTIGAELVDVTALNDDWQANLPGAGRWRLTAEKYLVTEAFLSLAAGTPGAAGPLTVQVKDPDGQTLLFEGQGYIVEGQLRVPNRAMSERIAIEGTGSPTAP